MTISVLLADMITGSNTRLGWRLRQPQPGHFIWTSRLGHIYHRPLLPILEPLPDPLVTDQSLIPLLVPVDTDWEHSQIWEQPPEPEPPPELDSHEDTPPF